MSLELPAELVGATTETLIQRYYHLSQAKLAGETRAGRHPSGHDDPANVEQNPLVREVLDAGLHAIVWEMAAIHHAISQRPGGFIALASGDMSTLQKPEARGARRIERIEMTEADKKALTTTASDLGTGFYTG